MTEYPLLGKLTQRVNPTPPFILTRLWRRFKARIWSAADHNTEASEFTFVAGGLIGVVGFPLYYFVWHDWFPQPYENLPLRLLGCLLCVPIVLQRWWPLSQRKLLVLHLHVTILFSLPFFFTFMLLKNDFSLVWMVSESISIFLLLLLVVDGLNFALIFVLGTGLAWICFWLTTDEQIMPPGFDLQYLPLFAFAVLTGGIVNYRHRAGLITQERLDTMVSVGSNIAHELRTPLLGIKSGAAGLHKYLPVLLDAYRSARDQGLLVGEIRDAHIQALSSVLRRIEMETDYSNAMIDMLLMNAGRRTVDARDFASHSAMGCVEQALRRYPFKSPGERQTVRWRPERDFNFWGSDMLLIHVLFNLLKNALYFVHKAGKGGIDIRLESGTHYNKLIFRDTGSGITAEHLPHIFNRFYTTRDEGDGIGLSFCAQVMNRFGGQIVCRSRPGEFAEFVLSFPPVHVSGARSYDD